MIDDLMDIFRGGIIAFLGIITLILLKLSYNEPAMMPIMAISIVLIVIGVISIIIGVARKLMLLK